MLLLVPLPFMLGECNPFITSCWDPDPLPPLLLLASGVVLLKGRAATLLEKLPGRRSFAQLLFLPVLLMDSFPRVVEVEERLPWDMEDPLRADLIGAGPPLSQVADLEPMALSTLTMRVVAIVRCTTGLALSMTISLWRRAELGAPTRD
jgi:hypothetical protein